MFKSSSFAWFVIIALLVVVLAYGYANRRMLYLHLLALDLDDIALLDQYEEKPGVQWHDDYFTVEYIDADTIAIGEPRYWQANYNYLVPGQSRAILFDSGPGLRDIRPGASLLQYNDLEELLEALQRIKNHSLDGGGFFPRTYNVNDNIQILTDIGW